jgi:GTP-binding protein
MIEGYLTGRPSLRRVMVLVDAEVGPTALDLQMLGWLKGLGLPFRPVATKADKVKPSRFLARRKELAAALDVAADGLLWVSASAGTGVAELRSFLTADLMGRPA